MLWPDLYLNNLKIPKSKKDREPLLRSSCHGLVVSLIVCGILNYNVGTRKKNKKEGKDEEVEYIFLTIAKSNIDGRQILASRDDNKWAAMGYR